MRRLPILLIFLILACSGGDEQMAKILSLEDHRVPCDSLTVFLDNPDARYQARALEAIGKLQDTNCLDEASSYLGDTDETVRLQAAFALGQLGSGDAEPSLLTAVNAEPSEKVRLRVIEALGKVGGTETVARLPILLADEKNSIRAEAAMGCARLALRDVRDSTLTQALIPLLQDSDKEVRWKACYALMRINRYFDPEVVRNALHDDDARVRMHAARSLGELMDIPSLELLSTVLRKDPDVRVRVNAANAFGRFPLQKVANYLTLHNQPGHARIAIIRAIGSSALKEEAGYLKNSREHNLAKLLLEQGLTQSLSPDEDQEQESWTIPEISHALISYGRLLGEEATDLLTKFAQHQVPLLRARAIDALGETNSPAAIPIIEQTYHGQPAIVKLAVLQALTRLSDFANPRIYLDALQERDQVIVALAADGLAQDSLQNRIHVRSIIEAYQRLPKPVDPELTLMIFAALEKFGDMAAISVLKEALNIPDRKISSSAARALRTLTGADTFVVNVRPVSRWEGDYLSVEKLKGAKAYIKTSRGNIEIALFAEEAPLTVLNFVELTDKGFYDRLTFHRVVPNFVIQGGDPRGDGWGSPGYAIRSEFNPRLYLRGTVGMASAGKDTEGSQFFITHSEQPHLDGRYTVFGQVTSGMEVVDTIMAGDIMELVSVRR